MYVFILNLKSLSLHEICGGKKGTLTSDTDLLCDLR